MHEQEGDPSLLQLRTRIEKAVGGKVDAVSNAVRTAGTQKPTGRLSQAELGKAIVGAGVPIASRILDEVWGRLRLENGEALSADILVYFAPPKVAKYLNRLNKNKDQMRKAHSMALECKRYEQAAALLQHVKNIDNEIETLPLDSDPLDTVHKAKERELKREVKKASTNLMKQNAINALNIYKELMEIGHTPVPTPRGGRSVMPIRLAGHAVPFVLSFVCHALTSFLFALCHYVACTTTEICDQRL